MLCIIVSYQPVTHGDLILENQRQYLLSVWTPGSVAEQPSCQVRNPERGHGCQGLWRDPEGAVPEFLSRSRSLVTLLFIERN